MSAEASEWIGLDEARQSLERSRPRASFEGVDLRLVLELIPPGADEFPELAGTEFGMQDRKGLLIHGTPTDGGGRRFEVGAVARRNLVTGAVNFLGPYVHGPSGSEFLYLNWRRPNAPPNEWVWRRKFPLAPITWEAAVEAALAGAAFFADGTGRRAHATVPVEWRRQTV